MALTFNHQTNDISNATGTVTFNGTAVGGDNTPVWFGSRGLFAGGTTSASVVDTIAYITIATPGNATDFGNLSTILLSGAALSGGGRVVFGGGVDWSVNNGANTNRMEYVTASTTGNVTDFGDLTTARGLLTAVSNGSRGVFAGGGADGSGNNDYNILDYITIATTGNATDFGDLLATNQLPAGAGGSTRGVIGGGYASGAFSNVIQYITIATTGNAVDFGDLLSTAYGLGATSNDNRCLFAGNRNSSNVIQYVTTASTGNATDFGDLTTARDRTAGVANGTRAVFGGGGSGGSPLNTIDYVTIASTGNATDFGDLTAATSDTDSASGN